MVTTDVLPKFAVDSTRWKSIPRRCADSSFTAGGKWPAYVSVQLRPIARALPTAHKNLFEGKMPNDITPRLLCDGAKTERLSLMTRRLILDYLPVLDARLAISRYAVSKFIEGWGPLYFPYPHMFDTFFSLTTMTYY